MAHRKAATAIGKPHCKYTVSQRHLIFINLKIHPESTPDQSNWLSNLWLPRNSTLLGPKCHKIIWLRANLLSPLEYLREGMFSGLGKE